MKKSTTFLIIAIVLICLVGYQVQLTWWTIKSSWRLAAFLLSMNDQKWTNPLAGLLSILINLWRPICLILFFKYRKSEKDSFENIRENKKK